MARRWAVRSGAPRHVLRTWLLGLITCLLAGLVAVPAMSFAAGVPSSAPVAGTVVPPSVFSHAVSASSGTTFAVPGIPTNPGDTILVFVAVRSSAPVTSVIDSSNDPFVDLGVTQRTDGSSHEELAVWAAYSVAGSSTTTITVFTGFTARVVLVAADITNVGAKPLVGLSPFAEGTSSLVSTSTPETSGDLVMMGVAVEGSSSVTAGSGETLLAFDRITSGATDTGAVLTADAPTNGSMTLSAGLSPSYPWIAVGLALEGLPASAPAKYAVSFEESGLPTGTAWSVNVSGTTASAMAPNPINWSEPNGSYPFQVLPVLGYLSNVSSGTIAVAGANSVVDVGFALLLEFPVEFAATGLPNGTAWSITLSGTTASATTPNLVSWSVPNGTYSFQVVPVPGYLANVSNGNVTVAGRGGTVWIGFTAVSPTSATPIQHVVVIVLENAELSTVLQNGPYESYLSGTYGVASQYYAACHYSLPNYIAMVSGRTFGCTRIPVSSDTNLADTLEGAGLTWGAYFESMPTPCDTQSSGLYDVTHNPFRFFSDIVHNSSRCSGHIVNSAAFNESLASGTLANFSLYIPNLENDGHNTGVAFADHWLSGFLSPILNSTDPTVEATVQHTAFFIVYDEGSTNLGYSTGGLVNSWCVNKTGQQLSTCGGLTYFVAVSPYSVGRASAQDSSPYNLESTIEWLFGLPSDGGWDGLPSFPPMTGLFSFTTNAASDGFEADEPAATSTAT